MEVIRLVAQDTAAAGHSVAIAYGVRPETPPDIRTLVGPGIELFRLPWTERSVTAHWNAVRALSNVIRKWNPDVVHLHSSFAGLAGAMVAPRRTVTIFTPHAYPSSMASVGLARRGAYAVLERFASRRATVVGAVSESEAEIARARWARRVIVVRNGIRELDQDDRGRVKNGEFTRVSAMGRIGPQRQPSKVARILESVRDLAETEWIGGAPPREPGLASLARAGVSVSGWLTRDAVMRRLRDSTVYLHWTAWDGQPLSILEALAVDAVVVASDIPPNREILGPSQVCASEKDAVALIRTLLTSDEDRDRALRNQRSRREMYRASRMSRDWLSVYERLLEPAGRST
jgi:glycosyltransferase involved in cell wall biosynthesis